MLNTKHLSKYLHYVKSVMLQIFRFAKDQHSTMVTILISINKNSLLISLRPEPQYMGYRMGFFSSALSCSAIAFSGLTTVTEFI